MLGHRATCFLIHSKSLVQWFNTREGPKTSMMGNNRWEPWKDAILLTTMNGVEESRMRTSDRMEMIGTEFSTIRRRQDLPSVPIIRYSRSGGNIWNMPA